MNYSTGFSLLSLGYPAQRAPVSSFPSSCGETEHQTTYQEPREFSKPLASPEMFPWCPPHSCLQGLKLSLRQTHPWLKRTHFARSNWGSRSTFLGTYNRREASCLPGPGSPVGDLVWQSPGEAAEAGQLQTLKDRTPLLHRGWVRATHLPLPQGTGGGEGRGGQSLSPHLPGFRGSIPAH